MSYASIVNADCQKEINKLCRKNPVLEKSLTRKIDEIIQNPHHYKPLRNILAGRRRVHILGNFVLSFRIDETNKTVIFLKFTHHDKAY